ncbi:Protein unc-13 homolog [Linum grandiflorum]
MEPAALLHRYRRDRRKLLDFLLSSGLIKELRTPPGSSTSSLSDLDLDSLSADYILHCLNSGGVIDVAEATKKYSEESAYPVMMESRRGNTYFLVGDPDSAGSPPRRTPPPINLRRTSDVSRSANRLNTSHSNATTSGNDHGSQYKVPKPDAPVSPSKVLDIPQLGLPGPRTRLSDDDFREAAYELLLASMFLSGIERQPVEDRKREKSSKFLSGLKNKRDKMQTQAESFSRLASIMDTARIQMQASWKTSSFPFAISETMDACVRRNLRQLAMRMTSRDIDLPHVALGLLNGIFKSDFTHEKSYRQWKQRQANILEELLCSSTEVVGAAGPTIKNHIAKIKDTEEWDAMSPSERVAVLASVRQVALRVSSLPGRFGVQGETFYWTAGYHLNVRIYQNLLLGLFDVLEEGQLIEESEELLPFIYSTWSTLGITQRIHNALYGWTLFQQFLSTGNTLLLQNVVVELQKVLSGEEENWLEQEYINSLACSRQHEGKRLKLNLVQDIVLSISNSCDSKLQDYHLNFSQQPSSFRFMVNLLAMVGVPVFKGSGELKFTKLSSSNKTAARKLKSYVKGSTEAACRRVESKIYLESKVEKRHPLALLADGIKLIAEKESEVFSPVLRHYCPNAVIISVVSLHQLFGEKLKPFLAGVSSFSEDVQYVLSAADQLDYYLTQLYKSASEANASKHYLIQDLEHYRIAEVSKPLVIDWVISQHDHILEWTGRAFDLEDWEPLSLNKRQAASIVEVFRIIEEAVDQFFGFNLPLDITHLQALLSIIFHSLDSYLQKLLSQLVPKNHLYPPIPPLTRYTESVMPVIKKKLSECVLADDNLGCNLDGLTVPKLCVRLNTLQYICKQTRTLEDGIRKSWADVRPPQNIQEEPLEESCSNEALDALFTTTLNIIRDTATEGINKISEFSGARIIFWDLRQKFLFGLYHGDVGSSRLESFLPQIDNVLDEICRLIDDTLRDTVVSSVCRASLEGFVWVMLNGGPSRAFSDSDVVMMEEDFNVLKEFFIASGEGLPRSVVDREAKYAEQILNLFSLQTETLIQMLMNASEHISLRPDTNQQRNHTPSDAQTLVRVLCHKKDREASKFLKRQYELPMSSEYDESSASQESTITKSPLITDLLNRSASLRSASMRWGEKGALNWGDKGSSSFRSLKKRFQEVTSEISYMKR